MLDKPDADRIKVRRGLPVMVVIACNTGQYDHREDCVGEAFFKQSSGPVAFIGGSRVTQPYFNGLFGKALVDHVFTAETLGEALTAAKRQVLAHARSPLTQQADMMAGMMQGGPKALPGMRRDGVRHYNLLGDPAIRLRKPADDLTVTVDGDTITVRGPVDRARITLEVARGKYARALPKVDLTAANAGEQLAKRYKAANDPVLQSWDVTLKNGVASVTFTKPTKPGTYYVKAHAVGHVGATTLKVAPPQADEDF